MRGKGIRAIITALLVLIPALLLLSPMLSATSLQPKPAGASIPEFSEELEQRAKSSFPFKSFFGQLRLNLLLFSGQQEQNGIFINSSGLLRRIDQPDNAVIAHNIETINFFADEARAWGKPVFVTALPSAAAIYRQNLPPFSSTVNQRQYIDDIMAGISGHATAVNMYSHLDSHRRQYIYYRTEDNLTSLGGFYVYSNLISRMLNIEPPSLRNYNLTYPVRGYYGDLYQISPYNEVEPDTLTLFHYTSYDREYTITHSSLTTRKTYHTLYPEHLAALGNETDIFLGGLSAITDIGSSAPYTRKLLVFGDKSALAYAPFLANHYRQLTIVDLFNPELTISDISLQDYTQVLFAYNAEVLMTKELPAELLIERVLPTVGE